MKPYVYRVRVFPMPEMKEALEADFRDSLNRLADLAIYARRTAAPEEERTLKHTELATDREIEEGVKRHHPVPAAGASWAGAIVLTLD